MIQFKEINGQLCLMLEKAVPLTEDAKFPCVGRFKSEYVSMAAYYHRYVDVNSPLWAEKPCPCVRTSVEFIQGNSRAHTDMRFIEILGYPVADHSAEWALYRVLQGDKVTQAPSIHHYAMNSNGVVFCYPHNGNPHHPRTADEWLKQKKTVDPTGWQIYAEPKPLLAEARKGDLCERRDGKWVQIDAIRNNGNKWSIFEAEGHSYHESGNAVCSELYHTKLDIISTEPLAPIGSAEWAWQMLMLGNKVWHPSEQSMETTALGKEKFVSCHAKTGWQLYEPKPEVANPLENGFYAVRTVDPIPIILEWYQGKWIWPDGTMREFEFTSNITSYMLVERNQWLIDTPLSSVKPQPKPAKEPVADCNNCKHVCTKSNIDYCHMYEPKPTYKVGDYVEYNDGAKISQAKIMRIYDDLYAVVDYLYSRYEFVLNGENITRKLQPSEVVIHIGCLSGTVCKCDDVGMEDTHFYLHIPGTEDDKNAATWCLISFSMLKPFTAELVRELIEKQQGDAK